MNPDHLVEALWFHLCYFFGRRGREGWAQMTKNTFNSEGHDYVSMGTTEITNNHQGGHKQNDIDYDDQRMYGIGVDIFRFYVSKLHSGCDRLFQHSLRKNEPMGKNTLANMMQRISKKAGLSCVYTCHSVRASTITNLFHAGVSTQSIISITKHKNTSSLGHYIGGLSSGQKRECASILTASLHASEASLQKVSTLAGKLKC